jgi:hypothetical protein
VDPKHIPTPARLHEPVGVVHLRRRGARAAQQLAGAVGRQQRRLVQPQERQRQAEEDLGPLA